MSQNGLVVHFVMDFAEKLILPSRIQQPGQLHFITGLRLDLFAISCSNLREDKIFCLSEGHWLNAKDTSSVLGIVYHLLRYY